MHPVVVDIYHSSPVKSFSAAKEFGILGVIHKASQNVPDNLYPIRRKQAASAGLLWGAYHFNTSEPVQIQVDRFFSAAQPDEHTRMCLDFERGDMSLHNAVEFLILADEKLGRRITLYSGNVIKEKIVAEHADQDTRDFLALHPFWLCEYGPKAKLIDTKGHPLPWSKYDLWQYAADGIPETNHIPGLPDPKIDVNHYDGTVDELAAGWAGPAC